MCLFGKGERCTLMQMSISSMVQTEMVSELYCLGWGHCLQQQGSKSSCAPLDLLTFVCQCQQMRHSLSGPFMLMK